MPQEETLMDAERFGDDDLPSDWIEEGTAARGMSFGHRITGAEADIYEDQGWTVSLSVDGDMPNFETRHTEFDEAASTLVNAMGLYNELADTTRNLCSNE